MKINIAFCPHFHQPHFQLHRTREEAFANCYLPWLELLEEVVDYPDFYINMHFSGPFLSWVAREKPSYLKRLAELVKQPSIGIIGGTADEAFSQLSSRPDEVMYQVQEYSRLTKKLLDIDASQWEGIHVVEREAGEMLLHNLAQAARVVGAPPLMYLDAETFYQSYYAYPGGSYDYCNRHFGFIDPYSRTTVSHLPEELLYFALRDELGGDEFFVLPIHSEFRYRLLKRHPFGEADRITIRPKQYLFYLKDAAEKACSMLEKCGRKIEPVVVIFEDAEKFGQWSKDPMGDARWLKELFKLIAQDEEVCLCSLKSYLNQQGYLDTYSAATSHSYAEWENWTAGRGIRGVSNGDERLRKLIARQRDIENKLNLVETYLLSGIEVDSRCGPLLKEAALNSPRRFEIIESILKKGEPAWFEKAYRLIQRARNVAYQEDPRWASRHPSYGSCAYFDSQGMGYLDLAERLLDMMADEMGIKGTQTPSIEIRDWDFDGEDEVVIRTAGQTAVIDTRNGNIIFQQATSYLGSEKEALLDFLEQDLTLPVAYSRVGKYSVPLIFTETDSDVTLDFGFEGARLERCRDGFGLSIAVVDKENYNPLIEVKPEFTLRKAEPTDGGFLIELGGTAEMEWLGQTIVTEVLKKFIIRDQDIKVEISISADNLNDQIHLQFAPELVVSAAPSDDVDFIPHSWLGLKGNRPSRYQVDVHRPVAGRRDVLNRTLSAPTSLVYVFKVRNGTGAEYQNTVGWTIESSGEIERVEVRPAVREYYRNHVFPEQSRLSYDSSGIMIRPGISIKPGENLFTATMTWSFGSNDDSKEYEEKVILLPETR
ncbi:MAG: hypothetical protein ACM3MK_04690 [Chitinophagales bacterium]